jgi:hypothetical protein
MAAAGHAELADRLHSGCFWDDLSTPLRPAVHPDAETGGLAIDADRATLRWSPAAGAFCYDLLRGGLDALEPGGGAVGMRDATCVADDTPATTATDAAAPLPGHGYYYVVKPNGVHGTYGSSSNGAVRVDRDGACPH